jgi:hypothetical protein
LVCIPLLKSSSINCKKTLAKPLGIASAVTYDTDKSVDGRSYYIHRFGEETGIRPVAAVSEDGTLWWCGGDYTCPTAGITN